jgi:RNA 2',3'-cyclic 3'-phosphodiesterase
MRIFVAVEIDDDARQVAQATAEALRREAGAALNARWVAPENMHLTVRFIGDVHNDRAPALLDALAPPLEIPAFELAFAGCGMFPTSGAPRVIWIGLAAGLPQLAALHDAFDRRLAPFGFEPERRPFSAHLTLARLKDPPKGARPAVQQAIRRVAVPSARCLVTRATVFQSHLSPRGSRYEPLVFVPLAAAP